MIVHQKKELDYYAVGSRDNIIISNSFLTALNPEQGGSPQKALAFFDKPTEAVESRSLENGTVIHKYAERPQEFGIAAVPRPSETLGDLSDEFYRLLSTKPDLSAVPVTVVSNLKTDKGRATEVLEIQNAYEKLQLSLELPTLEETIRAFRTARANTNAYRTYGEATLINNFMSKSLDYMKQLEKLKDKVLLTAADKEKVENCIASLRSNKLANILLGLSGDFDSNLVLKEWDIYFDTAFGKAKARIDNIYIDLKNKIIYVVDLKTTSKPISLFKGTIEYYRYYRQLALYIKAVKEAITAKKLLEEASDYTPFETIYDVLNECNIVPLIVAVETNNNYESCVFNIEDYMAKGREELLAICTRLQYHVNNNMWHMSMEQFEGNGIVKLTPDDATTLPNKKSA